MLARMTKTGLLLGLATLLFTTLSFSATNTIRLSHDVLLPGGQTLKAGSYQVVVNEKLDQVEFLQNSKVVATHACKCIPQEKKNQETQFVTEDGAGNAPTLQQIELKGETRIITLPS